MAGKEQEHETSRTNRRFPGFQEPAADGCLRIIGAETTAAVNHVQSIHHAAPTAAAALGRVLTGAILMAKELKNDADRLTLQVKGRGPIGGITAVSRIFTRNGAAGNLDGIFVKGYAENPYADLPLRASDGKLDVGGLVGKGFLSVILDLGLKEPYTGSVPLQSGEIAEDLSYYYAVSKQVPAAVSLGVLIDRDLSIRKAGGFLLQLLPGSTGQADYGAGGADFQHAICNDAAECRRVDGKYSGGYCGRLCP